MKIFFIITITLLFSTIASAHGMTEADKLAMLEASNLKFIMLGAKHMLSGYDHLLFLFGVIFFLVNTKDIVKFVSVFTLGHSITLIAATFLSIKANYFLIDAVIALSVIYKAFDNNKGFPNYFGFKSPNMLMMVFLFGLIHGFGLSTRLQEITIKGQSWDLFTNIISFNIGVELGQIIALIVMLIVLVQLRKSAHFIRYSKISNHLLMFLGFMLLLMQLHGYIHVKNQEEFGFNKKSHMHVHEDLEIEEQNRFKLN